MPESEGSLQVHPVTPRWWPALADLFDDGGTTRRCWCMYWRIGAPYRTRPTADNRADFEHVVTSGPPPGLVAVRAGVAIGWCQLTPRAALPALDRPWRLRPVDDLPVWAISCFYVRKGERRRGVTVALVTAALEHARAGGAPAVEAYPLDPAVSPSATSTGYLSTFTAAGFKIVAQRSPERPILRYEFDT